MIEKSELAPVAIFAYNRKDHLKKTVDALLQNKYSEDTEVFFFSDGSKCETDNSKIEEVREYLNRLQGFKKIHVIERKTNYGLAKNIEEGVTWILSKYEKIIVLEDDIVTAKGFLKYMNDALCIYEKEKSVMEISGYSVPADYIGQPETVFLKFGDCWGWATWRRAWDHFNRDTNRIIKRFNLLDIYHFNLEGKTNFWNQILSNKNGDINTWAIFWTAAIYLNNGYMLYPTRSLVKNIGFDGTGEHGAFQNDFDVILSEEDINYFPSEVKENRNVRKQVGKYYRLVDKETVIDKIRLIVHYFRYRRLVKHETAKSSEC